MKHDLKTAIDKQAEHILVTSKKHGVDWLNNSLEMLNSCGCEHCMLTRKCVLDKAVKQQKEIKKIVRH